MLFKRKDSFFLDLSKDSQGSPAVAVQVPVKQEQAPAGQPVQSEPSAVPASPAPGTASPTPAVAASAGPALTTAEAIAAELRAAQESRPAAPSATFAPECLNPANAVPRRRRTAGANLAVFKEMAGEMFRS